MTGFAGGIMVIITVLGTAVCVIFYLLSGVEKFKDNYKKTIKNFVSNNDGKKLGSLLARISDKSRKELTKLLDVSRKIDYQGFQKPTKSALTLKKKILKLAEEQDIVFSKKYLGLSEKKFITKTSKAFKKYEENLSKKNKPWHKTIMPNRNFFENEDLDV